MHGSSQGVPVSVGTMGGLVTLASPESLPVGASPRCYNNDYRVGKTKTRDGTTSAYTYSGAAVGPSPGTLVADVPLNGAGPWGSPGNVLLNNGSYATSVLSASPIVQGIVQLTV